MSNDLTQLEAVLARVGRLADELIADPDGHVHRSAAELRSAFQDRRAVEPALARMRTSLQMLRTHNHEGSRREFQRRERGLDHIEAVLENELLPHLRRIGFDV